MANYKMPEIREQRSQREPPGWGGYMTQKFGFRLESGLLITQDLRRLSRERNRFLSSWRQKSLSAWEGRLYKMQRRREYHSARGPASAAAQGV